MTEDEKYDIAVKLIGNGYLIHCTNAVFNKFDKVIENIKAKFK